MQEALEMIFTDPDSENDEFDCGSDFEAAPDSDEDTQTEDSDLDVSLLSDTVITPTEEQTTSETSIGEF